ncbi:hypothetical protein A2U01_0078680, partial [Trifolium medium]|nr:hypothetical protein [Trifolium medium]
WDLAGRDGISPGEIACHSSPFLARKLETFWTCIAGARWARPSERA